jgi:hypothetical protein
MGSHFEYLARLCETIVVRDPFLVSLEAVALASLSQETRSPALMIAAKAKYTRALRETNLVLQSPQRAVQDGTVIAVLLLSLFETITRAVPSSCDHWLNHVKGAVALLRLRGAEQFQLALGVELYKQVGRSIEIGCVQQRIRIPTEYLELQASVAPMIDWSDPILQFSAVVEAFTNLRAAIWYGELTDPGEIHRLATDLDRSLIQFALLMPPGWHYCVEDDDDGGLPPECAGKQHRYHSHRTAALWNAIRMARFMLNEIVYMNVCMMAPSALRDLLCEAARDNVGRMALEMCAAVPQFRQGFQAQTPSRRIIASGHVLIWPLSFVGASELVAMSLRQYAIESLRWIGTDMKIPQASHVAEAVEQGKQAEDWLVLYWLLDGKII